MTRRLARLEWGFIDMTVDEVIKKALKKARNKAFNQSEKFDWAEYFTSYEIIDAVLDIVREEIGKVIK